MPRFTDDAVVLRRFDWSETSQIAWLYTRSRGLVRGVAKGAKRPRSAFDGGLETLTRGEVGIITKPDADLATLTFWDLREVWWSVRTNLDANRAGLFAAGLLASIVTDQDPYPRLFDELTGLLASLESGSEPWAAVLRFQWAALEDTGHAPRLAEASAHSQEPAMALGFDPEGGIFTPDPGSHAPSLWRVRGSTVRAVASAAAGRAGDPTPEDVARANRFLMTYWTWILGREPRVARLLQGKPLARESRAKLRPGEADTNPAAMLKDI